MWRNRRLHPEAGGVSVPNQCEHNYGRCAIVEMTFRSRLKRLEHGKRLEAVFAGLISPVVNKYSALGKKINKLR